MSARVALAIALDSGLHRSTPDRHEPRAPRTHNLGSSSRIPNGEGRTYWVEGQEIAVFRDRRGRVFASQAWCPHHFGPLADGTVGYSEVICPLHGLRFDLRTGAARGHDCGALRTFPIRLTRAGDLLVTID